jgi:plastocyanin
MSGGRIGGLVMAAVLLAACSNSGGGGEASGSASAGSSGSASASPTTITIGNDTANDHGETSVTGKSSLEVEQDNFYFGPTVITGSAGQQLTVALKNEGTVAHTFTIPSLNVDVELQPDQTKDVQLTFPSSGFTEFYCRFHRTSGMVGELTVA